MPGTASCTKEKRLNFASLQPCLAYQIIASQATNWALICLCPKTWSSCIYVNERVLFFFKIHLFISVRSLDVHLRTKSHLLSTVGSSSSGIIFIWPPTVSVSAEAERIDLQLTLLGRELKGRKEVPAASSNIVISFFQGCRAKIIWLWIWIETEKQENLGRGGTHARH